MESNNGSNINNYNEATERRATLTGTSTSRSSITNIEHLNQQWLNLDKVETLLLNQYEQLVKEEQCLRKAIQESKETGREKMIRERKEREEQAMNRLEEALMMDSSGSSESSDESMVNEDEDEDEDEAVGMTESMRREGLTQVLRSDDDDDDDDDNDDDKEMNEEELLQMLN